MPIRFLMTLCMLLVLLAAAQARADVYRCPGTDGEAVYQDYPCESGSLLMHTDAASSPAAMQQPARQPGASATTSTSFPRWLLVLLVYAAMSLLCYFTYAWDKRAAIDDGQRVPERTLHLMALLGGWPGALVAQRLLRHKTRKLSFQLVFWGIVLLHAVFWTEVLSHGALHRAVTRLLTG